MKSYCFRNKTLKGKCLPTEREAIADAIRAGQAYRDGDQLVWRVPGEIGICVERAGAANRGESRQP